MANSIENKELDLAFEFVQYTHKNVFLTGNAGTGKTTFLHNLKTKTFKRMVVVAPTGVAAINAGGVTIHSFFQMPFSPNIPVDYSTDHDLFGETRTTRNKQSLFKFGSQKIKIIKSLDLLVIDEISMVRSDVLDGIDEVLRRYKDRTKPFGGVQLLMIGDMHQLAPVVKEDEWSILRKFYDTVYFYSSKALQQTSFISIELKHIYRQSDQTFIDLLNKVRNDKLDYEGIEKLNGRHIPGFERKEDDGYIILTTHNAKAKEINESKLAKLKSASYFYYADVEGDFPEYSFPTDGELELKEGAQVMFIKNDFSPEKLFFNGKIGTITGIEDDSIFVQCENEDFPIEVQKMEWENVKYELDNSTKELKENTVGVFRQ